MSQREDLGFNIDCRMSQMKIKSDDDKPALTQAGSSATGTSDSSETNVAQSQQNGGYTIFHLQQLYIVLHADLCVNESCRLEPHCTDAKILISHMVKCNKGPECTVPYCNASKQLVWHARLCPVSGCSLCTSLDYHLEEFSTAQAEVIRKCMMGELKMS